MRVLPYLLLSLSLLLLHANICEAQWDSTAATSGWGITCFGVNSSPMTKLFVGTNVEGIYRLTVNPITWTHLDTKGTLRNVLAIAVSGSDILAAEAYGLGIYRSTDDGTSWAEADSGLTDRHVYALFPSGTDIFAATNSGVFRSTDRGVSWISANTGLSQHTVTVLAANKQSLYAGTNGGGVYLSTNKGASWTALGRAGLTDTMIYALAVNGNKIWVATLMGGVFLSRDNGMTWSSNNTGITGTVRAFVFAQAGIFAGSDAGVYLSSTAEGNWISVNEGMPHACCGQNLAILDTLLIRAGPGYVLFRRPLSEINPPPPPVLISPANGSTGIAHDPTLMWEKVNRAYMYRVQVSTMPGMDTCFINQGVLTVPSNDISGLASYVKYYWRVDASTEFGEGPWSDIWSFTTGPEPYPSMFTLDTTIDFPVRQSVADYTPADYRIVGLPGAGDIPVTNIVTGESRKAWKIYWDNGGPSDYLEYYEGSPTFRFSAGRAFWVLKTSPMSIKTNVPTISLDTSGSVTIPLHPGWNLITDPFTGPVAWPLVQSLNGITDSLYQFTGSFSPSASLDPYVGYYLFNSDTLGSLRIPYRGLSAKGVPAPDPDATAWKVNITLKAGNITDRFLWFGASGRASGKPDKERQRKPRTVGTTPCTYFNRPGWDPGYPAFASDMRSEFADSALWSFEVQTDLQNRSQLIFSGIDRIPVRFEAYLTDETEAKIFDLRKDTVVLFVPVRSVHSFRVIIGTKAAIAPILRSITPHEYSLGQNYPNPFNPTTIIPVDIPEPSDVVLKIYDMLGRCVRDLFRGSLSSGRHYFTWDGRDARGKSLSSGMYIIGFDVSGGFHAARKIVLMR